VIKRTEKMDGDHEWDHFVWKINWMNNKNDGGN
jgi:hypothetical protein